MMYSPELLEAYSQYAKMRDHIGTCNDGGCLVLRPQGMHTNGGCKCSKDGLKAQRMMWVGQNLFDALTQEIAKDIR